MRGLFSEPGLPGGEDTRSSHQNRVRPLAHHHRVRLKRTLTEPV